MTTLTRYLVPCLTEGENVPTDYMDHVPTRCPNNVDHIIDPLNIFAESVVHTKTVRIDDTCDIKTGGYFRADQHQMSIDPSTTSMYDVRYPYNVGVYSVTFMPGTENIGDTFHIIGLPNTPIGTLTANLDIGLTILSMTPYSGFEMASLNPGFVLNIYDGTNYIELGHILAVTGSTIEFSTPVPTTLSSGLQVQIGIPRVLGGKFITTNTMPLGMAKIGSSPMAAGKSFRVYYNNSTDQAKTINFIVELIY